MSNYTEELLNGLEDTNFAEKVKLGHINWICKSNCIKLKVNIVVGGYMANSAFQGESKCGDNTGGYANEEPAGDASGDFSS